jgi:predicted DNA-binding protein
MYTMLYMSSTRTQIYLTKEQRDRLDERGAQTGLGLAEMIRRAVDDYLGDQGDMKAALDETFGVLTDLELPARG